MPFAFETGGRVCVEAEEFITFLATRQQLVEQTRLKGRQVHNGVLRQRLVEAVSVAIAIGDARSLVAARERARAAAAAAA